MFLLQAGQDKCMQCFAHFPHSCALTKSFSLLLSRPQKRCKATEGFSILEEFPALSVAIHPAPIANVLSGALGPALEPGPGFREA